MFDNIQQHVYAFMSAAVHTIRKVTYPLHDVTNKTRLKHVKRLDGYKISIIGDSVSFGLKATTNYGQYIQKYTGASIQNLAISGACMADINVNSIYQQALQVNEADIYILQGTDDDWLANVPIGNEDDDTMSYLGAFYQIIHILRLKNNNAKIILVTPTYQSPVKHNKIIRTDRTKNNLGYDLHDYVSAQIRVARLLNIEIVNLMQRKVFNPDNIDFRQQYMRDGLHPNAKGHVMIADYLLRHLR